MEQEIARKLVPILLNKIIEFHCRKGFRPNCDCEYCAVKADAFWNIYTAGRRLARQAYQESFADKFKYSTSGLPSHNRIWDPNDDIGYFVWLGRKKLRKLWRAELARLKNQILTGEPTLEEQKTRINPAF